MTNTTRRLAGLGLVLLGASTTGCAAADDAAVTGVAAGDETGGATGSGGRQTGGTTGSGGSVGSGGAAKTGGTANTGGSVATGGVANTGGTANAGGSVATGGAANTGGSPKPDAGPPPGNPCIEAGTCPLGEWINVTPAGIDLTNTLGCGNYGTETMQGDPMHPGDFYTLFMCQGIWKSSDYGQTWKGPINTGAQGTVAGDCAGGITIPPSSTASVPTVYEACIRGNAAGFWRLTNGGVDWTRYTVGPGGSRQDFYPPAIDPYDPNHLIMAGHEMNVLVESADGGQTWTSVATNAGMNQNGGTAWVYFVDTGSAATTRKTFLWLGQASTVYGTWRTTDAGGSWTKVDGNEHLHGTSQLFQPDTSGVVFMPGVYSALGWGVLRSADYGKTWVHVGRTARENVVFGTPKFVYAMDSGASGLGSVTDPGFALAPAPGTGTWTAPGTPSSMTAGAAQAAVSNDGTHNVIVTANWGAGVWRYVEP